MHVEGAHVTTEERLTAKQQAQRAIESLPDDATIEDAIDCLYLLHKIETGLKEARQGMLIPHDQVAKSFAQWLR
jgi:predicted transcriptional regulator